MITPSGLLIPDPPKPADRPISLVLTGLRAIMQPVEDDGYHGCLRVVRNGIVVELRITHAQHEKFSKMGIEEWT